LPTNKRRDGRWVHTRKMEIHTLDLGDHQILVEGKLMDTRVSQSPPGEPEQGPILVHHLIARVWVQGPDLTIAAAEAEMPTIPREICPQALPATQKLVGLKIRTGFTQKVKDLIGDVKGCSHLTNLFLTMGPVAVQGYFAAYGKASGARPLDHPALSRVIDSCHVWRKDGSYVKSLTAAWEKENKRT
jgi:hypothetical protein